MDSHKFTRCQLLGPRELANAPSPPAAARSRSQPHSALSTVQGGFVSSLPRGLCAALEMVAEPPCPLFVPQEDALLTKLIKMYGTRNWSLIASGVKGRSGKSCRLR